MLFVKYTLLAIYQYKTHTQYKTSYLYKISLIITCTLLEKEQWLEFVSLEQQKDEKKNYLQLVQILNAPEFLSARILKSSSLVI